MRWTSDSWPAGLLGPHCTPGHGVWLTEAEVERVAETGTRICHNCSSNLRLRSGVAALNRREKRGLRVAIGIDEAGLNDDRDMLLEMRLVQRQHCVPGMNEADIPTPPRSFAWRPSMAPPPPALAKASAGWCRVPRPISY